MTPNKEHLQGLVERATPGPWRATSYRGCSGFQVWAGEQGLDAVLILEDGDADAEADAELAALAPTLATEVLRLTDTLESLAAENARLREALGPTLEALCNSTDGSAYRKVKQDARKALSGGSEG